jgi:mannose-1-phosphate guanylyltransferase/mannose-6-phosphate isomerase
MTGGALIHPVILSVGTGTRLWPLSRPDFPKQFLPLIGNESLFQAALQRFNGPGFTPATVVTAAA